MLPEYPRFVLRFFFGALCWQERVPGIRAPETCHRGYYVLSAKEGGVSCLVRSSPVDLDDDDDDMMMMISLPITAVAVAKAVEAAATAQGRGEG